MEEVGKIEMTKSEAEQFRALLEVGLQEMDEASERMDRYEAQRLKDQAETRLLMDRIKALLNVETTG